MKPQRGISAAEKSNKKMDYATKRALLPPESVTKPYKQTVRTPSAIYIATNPDKQIFSRLLHSAWPVQCILITATAKPISPITTTATTIAATAVMKTMKTACRRSGRNERERYCEEDEDDDRRDDDG
ncbi:hypothetical protein [Neisseria yangbaofengii]|uniref:hypothetical protein n=1 Tax=Neisseria yangbaofengii TaxID=2709396 RepID=UPI0013EB79AE|nr:hypothetical protein [Neisseria yangbaofengii]